MCIATGMPLSSEAACIRFVQSPDGSVVPDLAKKLPGRGAWVAAKEETVRQAVKKNAFSRALKGEAVIDGGADRLVRDIRAGLNKRALDLLGLAKKSGNLISGFEKVRAGLKKEEFLAYIYASDSAADGRDKLLKLIAAASSPCHTVGIFPVAQLDLALGNTNSVHLGLKDNGAGRAFMKEINRLSGFLPTSADHLQVEKSLGQSPE